MTLPNDSHVSGSTTFATHLISSKEYPVGVQADADGHIRGSLPAFGLFIPPAAAGAGSATAIRFDLWNGSASNTIRLRKLFAVVATDVAVTGTVGIRLDVFRTSAVGAGGTAASTAASTSTTAPCFWGFRSADSLPSGISARAGTITSGATSAQFYFPAFIFGEETNMSAHIPQYYNLLLDMPTEQPMELAVNQGIKVVQGSVASAGNYGFLVAFTVE